MVGGQKVYAIPLTLSYTRLVALSQRNWGHTAKVDVFCVHGRPHLPLQTWMPSSEEPISSAHATMLHLSPKAGAFGCEDEDGFVLLLHIDVGRRGL